MRFYFVSVLFLFLMSSYLHGGENDPIVQSFISFEETTTTEEEKAGILGTVEFYNGLDYVQKHQINKTVPFDRAVKTVFGTVIIKQISTPNTPCKTGCPDEIIGIQVPAGTALVPNAATVGERNSVKLKLIRVHDLYLS